MTRYLIVVALATLLCLSGWSGVRAAPNSQTGPMHYVQAGETLEYISAHYGVTVDALMRYNGLSDPDFVYVGQQLYIPPGGHAPGPRPGLGSATACGRSHLVRPGETLSDIAFRYGVSLHELVRHNNMANSNMIYAGQSLCLPGGASYAPQTVAYAAPPNVYHHRVLPGDTIHGIAGHYGVDYQQIIRANQLGNAAIIIADQVLVIPGYQAQPQPAMQAPSRPPVPAPAAGYAPKYVEPQYVEPPKTPPHAGPPPSPYHEDIYDSSVIPPVEEYPPYPPKADYEKGRPHPPKVEYDQDRPYPPKAEYKKGVPPAPDYQAEAKEPLLPLADHPIEVVINGGVTWVDESFSTHDPDGITTLIVRTGDEYGLKVRIRSGDYEAEGYSDISFLGEFGPNSWVFRYIPAGDYDVWIEDPERPSEKVKVDIEPGERVYVTFREGLSFSGPTFASPSGWFLAAFDNPSKPKQNIGGWSNILVRTPASGLKVRIESEGGGYQAYCTTGSKGDGACDFAALMAGFYYVTIDGTDFTVKTYMDGAAYATFDFARQGGVKSDKNVIGPVDYPVP